MTEHIPRNLASTRRIGSTIEIGRESLAVIEPCVFHLGSLSKSGTHMQTQVRTLLVLSRSCRKPVGLLLTAFIILTGGAVLANRSAARTQGAHPNEIPPQNKPIKFVLNPPYEELLNLGRLGLHEYEGLTFFDQKDKLSLVGDAVQSFAPTIERCVTVGRSSARLFAGSDRDLAQEPWNEWGLSAICDFGFLRFHYLMSAKAITCIYLENANPASYLLAELGLQGTISRVPNFYLQYALTTHFSHTEYALLRALESGRCTGLELDEMAGCLERLQRREAFVESLTARNPHTRDMLSADIWHAPNSSLTDESSGLSRICGSIYSSRYFGTRFRTADEKALDQAMECIAGLARKDFVAMKPALAQFRAKYENASTMHFLTRGTVRNAEAVLEYRALFERRVRAALCGVRLCSYWAAHGTFPPSLDTLRAEWPNDPIEDPLTGFSFQYSRNGDGFVLSVTENGGQKAVFAVEIGRSATEAASRR